MKKTYLALAVLTTLSGAALAQSQISIHRHHQGRYRQ